MGKPKNNPRDAIDKTSAGGHLGGTNYGQKPDAKTTSSVDRKGSKARPNDSQPQSSK